MLSVKSADCDTMATHPQFVHCDSNLLVSSEHQNQDTVVSGLVSCSVRREQMLQDVTGYSTRKLEMKIEKLPHSEGESLKRE